MKNLILAAILGTVGLVAASGSAPRPSPVGGICIGVQPVCLYPQHVVCTCDSYGFNCYWRCAQ